MAIPEYKIDKLPYKVTEARGKQIPILVSVPHCGTDFPEDIRDQYIPNMIDPPCDTDSFVQDLYDFVPEMGITMIESIYSRWVIDLNRDPESKPLYSDGRIITGLATSTTFNGDPIYLERGPDEQEIKDRLNKYYWPYYSKVQLLISRLHQKFGKVLLFDAHSIAQLVPGIREEAFPDLILGDNDEKSAHKNLIETALDNLASSDYELKHNTPFKGGHITRYFGKPEQNVHALQLEMTKINYMDDSEIKYDRARANKMREVLSLTFQELAKTLDEL